MTPWGNGKEKKKEKKEKKRKRNLYAPPTSTYIASHAKVRLDAFNTIK